MGSGTFANNVVSNLAPIAGNVGGGGAKLRFIVGCCYGLGGWRFCRRFVAIGAFVWLVAMLLLVGGGGITGRVVVISGRYNYGRVIVSTYYCYYGPA